MFCCITKSTRRLVYENNLYLYILSTKESTVILVFQFFINEQAKQRGLFSENFKLFLYYIFTKCSLQKSCLSFAISFAFISGSTNFGYEQNFYSDTLLFLHLVIVQSKFSTSQGFKSCAIARVILGQTLNIVNCEN